MPTILLLGLENAGVATALALILGVCTPWLRRRPALAHVLWALVLIKLVTPPLQRFALPTILPVISVSTPTPDPAAEANQFIASIINIEELLPDETLSETEISEPLPALTAPILPVSPAIDLNQLVPFIPTGLLLIWGLGSALTLALILVRARRFARLLYLADSADDLTYDLVDRVADRLSLSSNRRPHVLTIPGVISPVVWSFGRNPFLLLPFDLWKRLDGPRRESLVAHELAHLKRGDDRLRFLEVAATVLFWWLPVVYWARRALRDAEEQCCDAWVVSAFPGSSRAYAETLVDAIDFLNGASRPLPMAASGFGHPHQLKRRVIMVMKGNTPRSLGLAGGLLSLAVSAALLPVGPTWAHAAEPEPAKAATTETQQIRVVVNASDDAPDVNKALLGLVVNKPDADDDDEKKPAKAKGHEVVSFFTFSADAKDGLQKAIERLDAQVKEAREKGDKARADALSEAVAGLKKALETQSDAKPALAGRKLSAGDLKLQFSPSVAAKPLDPEELKSLNAEIKKQSDELRDLGKKMADSQRKLTEATRKLHQARGFTSFKGQELRTHAIARSGNDEKVIEFTAKAPGMATVTSDGAWAHITAPATSETHKTTVTGRAAALTRSSGGSDQDRRLADLEKKLDRVLGELDSLKSKSEKKKKND